MCLSVFLDVLLDVLLMDDFLRMSFLVWMVVVVDLVFFISNLV